MKRFGFGCMRLPMKTDGAGKEELVDYEEFNKMIDLYMEAGFNYFDTAHGYLNGKSETAIRDCLTKRYPRESYILTDKLSGNYWEVREDIRPFFEKQLAACGVEYFDYYLMHAMNAEGYKHYKENGAFETAAELKKEGKIKHMGISFHDKADVLEKILKEQPSIEVVQLQFNYADFEDEKVQSGKAYEVCVKYGKPVIVMEPVKGGALAALPAHVGEIIDGVREGSQASFAVRFAASFEQVVMVLSGMSSVEQMKDNLEHMKNFKPLNEKELEAARLAGRIFRNQDMIACTACHYCTEGCPKQIPIPELFSSYNALKSGKEKEGRQAYEEYTDKGGKASDCIKCGKCEKICPQQLSIKKYLEEISEIFEA